MCRWLAYSGEPIPLEQLIVRPENSLIDQSMSAKMAAFPTNADGVGVGWYGRNNEPGTYHSTLPCWNDENLRQLTYHVESHLFLAHIRHSTGTPVQQTNCHPFRYGNWLFVHNGLIRGFQKIKHGLVSAIDAKYFPHIQGTTDSEIIFFLALTFGLQKDIKTAVEKAVGLVEKLGKEAGIEHPMQMSLGFTDADKLYAFRYSSEGESRSLFYSDSADAIHKIYPKETLAKAVGEKARAIVSEPLVDLPGVWLPVEESTMVVVQDGEIEFFDFSPSAP